MNLAAQLHGRYLDILLIFLSDFPTLVHIHDKLRENYRFHLEIKEDKMKEVSYNKYIFKSSKFSNKQTNKETIDCKFRKTARSL